MVEKELHDLICQIQARCCEEQTTEVKAAHGGCPEKLYDTISAFSNQNSGGVFVFGLDEKDGFKKVGVYDAQDLQKKVMEYGEQMTPVVRPVFTVYEENGLLFVSAEIPPVDVADRPCFKTAKGRLRGSYIRVGDADKPMSEYEVYSYEAFRKKYQDDIRAVRGASFASLDQAKLDEYLSRKKSKRPHLASIPTEQLYELTGITREGQITMAAVLLLGIYPQAYFPQLCMIATCVPGNEMGTTSADGNRFWDSKRIEGTLSDILEGALAFVQNNMRTAVKIDDKTGKRIDQPQYPLVAVREAIVNALVHRDYSAHTEGMPIQLIMYQNRLEIINPGGLYGRLTVDQLGNVQPDTRNPVLATAMEVLGSTENRYSGIPTIRHLMKELALPQPVFEDTRDSFRITLYHQAQQDPAASHPAFSALSDERELLRFCRVPRSRAEIVAFLGIPSAQYALRRYLDPLVQAGAIQLTIPDKPRSTKQRYITAVDS